jgi:Tfp pilus assembly protein PilO
MAQRTQYLSGVVTILTVLLLVWQYTVFDRDHTKLLKEVEILEQAFEVFQKIHVLPQLQEELSIRNGIIETKIPTGDLLDIDFIKAIRTTCLLNSSTCLLFEKKQFPNTFYNEKRISFKIRGQKDDVYAMLKEVESSQRLINWQQICQKTESAISSHSTFEVSFLIYHFPHLSFKAKNPIHRPNLETETWLPPFTYYIRKTREKAETIYDMLMVTPNAEDQLNTLKEYNWEKDMADQKQSIIETLQSSRGTLERLLTNSSPCSQ